MKNLLFFAVFQLLSLGSWGQDSFYDLLDWGEYQVFYGETTIYDDSLHYEQFGYSGAAPLFVQVWYPSYVLHQPQRLKYDDFVSFQAPAALEMVRQELEKRMEEILIRDGLNYHIETGEAIDYGELKREEILSWMRQTETRSFRNPVPFEVYAPVIVYHHGSQGLACENSVMAEYFASKGYVFISANFHLPYENTVYGLLPYELAQKNKHDQSSAKALVRYARRLSRGNPVFYVGHSWGAQEGWCFLQDPAPVEGFVSMETTLEYRSDLGQIQDLWPYVYEALHVRKNPFSVPILAFAALEEETQFDLFKAVASPRAVFASYRKPFAHNSYTSMYLRRYFLRDRIPLPDGEIMGAQIEGYLEHLRLMEAFFESVMGKKELDFDVFEENFRIE